MISKGFKVVDGKSVLINTGNHPNPNAWLFKKATFSLVKTVSKTFSEPELPFLPKLIGGVGLFKCRQTGELITRQFKCAREHDAAIKRFMAGSII